MFVPLFRKAINLPHLADECRAVIGENFRYNPTNPSKQRKIKTNQSCVAKISTKKNPAYLEASFPHFSHIKRARP